MLGSKRPEINHLYNKINELNRSNYQNIINESKKITNVIKKFIKKTKSETNHILN